MSPHVDDTGGNRHRPPGPGAERGTPAGAGAPRRGGPPSVVGTGRDGFTGHDGFTGATPARPDPAWIDPAEPEGHGPDGGGVVDAEEDELTVVRRERDEYLEMVRRVQADFENYKKRMVRQQTDQLERATENLVAKLLPALDAFDLTRAHLRDEDSVSAEVKALLQASGLMGDALGQGRSRADRRRRGALRSHRPRRRGTRAGRRAPGRRRRRYRRIDNRRRDREGDRGVVRTGRGRCPAARVPVEGPCDPPGHGARTRVTGAGRRVTTRRST